MPCRGDALGVRVNAALDALRIPLRDGLRRSVGSIFQPSTIDPPASGQAAVIDRAALHAPASHSAPSQPNSIQSDPIK
jgi:hypothetical protein